MKTLLIKLHFILSSQIGIDPRKFLRTLQGLPRYLHDFLRFRSGYSGEIKWMPCLHDWYEEGGTTKSEYFWQDLLVARMIYAAHPTKHVDIGSRVDGFVSHVASFREIEVFDVRPIKTKIPGITFRQADLINPLKGMAGYCDSLSCLHALEHFGLGRYGDQIDTNGYANGFANMANLLKGGGIFYLSVPIGNERVEFNANRVFTPQTIINLANNNMLNLSSFTAIYQNGDIKMIDLNHEKISGLAAIKYALGIFVFEKE